MRRLFFSLMLVVFLLIPGVAPAVAAPPVPTDPGNLKDLAAARAATAKYHDVSVALADGYAPGGPCVASPAGGMGVHYSNSGLFDGTLDVTAPEILLYVPTESGPRLVGAEYHLDLVYSPSSAPVLFGHTFDGPMAGHGPGQPTHYDLHVWLWEANPDSIFAPFNPNVHCD